jgi:hypothetical protein
MIEAIIGKINDGIIQRLNDNIGQNLLIQGIGLACPVSIQSENDILTVMTDSDSVVNAFSDENHAVVWYHHLLQKTYEKVKGFGDDDIEMATTDVVLVCRGFSDRLSKSAFEFERDFIVPSVSKHAVLLFSDFDSSQIVLDEFKKKDYLVAPKEFIFSVKYKIRNKTII